MLNRTLADLARHNYLMAAQNAQDRKARTRTLIQAGGLLKLSGLLEICDIDDQENLQDLPAQQKAATLLGLLIEASERFLRAAPADQNRQRQESCQRGTTLLRQSAAKNGYVTGHNPRT